MGTWGTGLYSNDTALDVKDTCQEIFPFLSIEEGNEVLFKEFGQDLNSIPVDNDDASFWYALSDWQWKHGMLTEEIKTKTINLLVDYTGISEWETDASAKDVKKRKAVLDALLDRLNTPQPPLKKPKAQLRKPWHKLGDIWIFKTCSDSEFCWNATAPHFSFTYYNQDNNVRDAWIDALNNDWIFDMRGKYVAVVCVGTQLEQHSKYVPNIYDEDSVYAVYDYIGDVKPTINDLTSVGFLSYPVLEQASHTVLDLCRNVWCYQFTGYGSFKNECDDSYVLHVASEVDRFKRLAQTHNISSISIRCVILHQSLFPFFLPKVAYQKLGLNFNTLIDPLAPPLPCPLEEELKSLREEIDAADKRYRKRHGLPIF